MYLTGPLHAHTRDETVVQEVLLFYASHQGYGIQEKLAFVVSTDSD